MKINQDIKKEDEAIQDDQEEILMNEKEENEILKSMRYEYYIHYFGMDKCKASAWNNQYLISNSMHLLHPLLSGLTI